MKNYVESKKLNNKKKQKNLKDSVNKKLMSNNAKKLNLKNKNVKSYSIPELLQKKDVDNKKLKPQNVYNVNK